MRFRPQHLGQKAIVLLNLIRYNRPFLDTYLKANRMLGFIRRSPLDTHDHDKRTRKLLYLSLVRNNLAYCSQVCAPQAVNLIIGIETIQRRVTYFIQSLPYRSEVSNKQRLLKIGLLPLSYWHEFLDLVCVFKCLVSISDLFISVMNSARPRRTVYSKGTLLNTIRANTLTFENSFYYRATRIWSTLPAHLWNTDCSVAHFKKDLFNYFLYILKSVYDVDTPRPLRVYVLGATLVGHWTVCSIVCVVDFLSMSSPILFLHFRFFFVVSKVLSIVVLVGCIPNFHFVFWTLYWSLLCEWSRPLGEVYK